MAAYTAIDDPEAFHQSVTWTGNETARAITLPGDTNMQPDMVWIKEYSSSDENSWRLADSARGVASKWLATDNADAEGTSASVVTALSTDGFSIGAAGAVNYDGESHIGYCWKAGTTSGITTDGNTTITPSAYSFSQDAGFSAFIHAGNATSGAKLAHGLGAIPHMIIMKNRGTGNEWVVYHHENTAAPETDGLVLNTTAATADDASYWNDTAPDSVNITLGNSGATNDSSNNYVAFAFTSIKGFSKFGGYTGNGNTDGPYIHLGFRPAFLMTKRTDSTNGWRIRDNKRDPINPAQTRLYANTNDDEEANDNDIDWLANGFKLYETGAGENASSGKYIYVAFAESPFANSNGVPNNAR